MNDEQETQAHLMAELAAMRQQVQQLEAVVRAHEQIREALQENQEIHRIVLSHVSDAVFVTDEGGNFTYVCPNIHMIFGYTDVEVVALGNVCALLGDDFLGLTHADETGEVKNIEHTVITKSGEQRVLLINIKRVAIYHGTLLFTCRDISERKQSERALEDHRQHLEALVEARTHDLVKANERLYQEIAERQLAEAALRESEERYRTLVEFLPAGLLAIRNGRYIFSNPAGARILRLHQPPRHHWPTRDGQHRTHSQAIVKQRIQNLDNGLKNPPHEVAIQRPDGSTLSIESTSIPIMLNGQMSGLIIGQDITTRKQAEAALRESRSEFNLQQQIATTLLTTPEEHVYEQLLQTILDIFTSEYGYVGYIDDNGDLVLTSLTQNTGHIHQNVDRNIVFSHESWSGIWGKSLQEKRTYFSNTLGCAFPKVMRHCTMP
ncbi:MAG: PAS domain S-box protein [Chloroflexota bacterium]